MKRFHVHVAVADLTDSIRFYSRVFGADPAVRENEYAKWMLEDPRINFAISSHRQPVGVNHLGFQVDTDEELRGMQAQLRAADARMIQEDEQPCCYARSDKYWVTDPTGIAWETFHTLGSIPVLAKTHLFLITASPLYPPRQPALRRHAAYRQRESSPKSSVRSAARQMSPSPDIRRGRSADLPPVLALLETAGLPTADLKSVTRLHVWVLEAKESLAGVIALERHGSEGLLRSLVVAPEYRKRGFATALVRRLEDDARAEGVEILVLLTETAESFFRRLGYQAIERCSVSEALSQSAEFRSLCPMSAICMSKALGQSSEKGSPWQTERRGIRCETIESSRSRRNRLAASICDRHRFGCNGRAPVGTQ